MDEHWLGDNPESLIGSTLKDPLIGTSLGNPIEAEGTQNKLTGFSRNENGTYTVSVQELEDFGKGAKVDIFTRGLVGEDMNRREAKRFAKGLSLYNEATGSGPAISEDNQLFALFGSAAGKGDAVDTLPKLAVATIKNLEEMDQPVLATKYTDLLKERGINVNTGRFDSSLKGLDEFKKTQDVVKSLMEDAGTRIRELAIVQPGKLNAFGKAYAATAQGKDWSGLDEFMLRYSAPGDMTIWDHTKFDAPKQVSVTYDILQDLSIAGNHGALKDIMSRLEYTAGDPAMTRDVAKYLDGDTSAITQRIGMREALNGKTSTVGLSTIAGERERSIFDVDHPLAKNNFIVDLPDGSSLPVLGHDAYGGGTNRYGIGQASATDREKSLRDVFKAYESGADTKAIEAAKKLYIEGDKTRAGLHEVLAGKKSYLRADNVDPLGQGGFMQPRNSSLRMADGAINPFEVKVNIDYVRRLKDKELSEALMRGETAHGAIARYPVSSTPLVSLKLDKSLRENEFGIDEGLTPMLRGDFDKDSVYVYPFSKGS